jgi:hypothetical protein
MGTERNIGVAALALALFARAGLAQMYQAPPEKGASGRAAMLASLQRGKEITVRGVRYRHLPEVLAVERGTAGTPPGEVLENKGRLVLYRAAAAGAPTVRSAAGKAAYPAVLNTQTGALGVLTGNLIVKPKNMTDADAIAADHALDRIQAYAQLRTVIYSAKAGVDLADASAALQADPRVESAYPEIIEHVRVPK